ncbi:MAG: thiolase family protein [Candidatus Bathyarchaeia archaeon]
MTKRKWERGVSIIGCGMTKMGTVLDSPWLKGMTERELLAWAVMEAVQDAGIKIDDIDSIVVGQFQGDQMKTKCIHAIANSWLGLEGKPGYSLVHACGLAAAGITIAGNAIASGMEDIVVVSATSITSAMFDEDFQRYRKHPGIRKPIPWEIHADYLYSGFDQAYDNPITGIGGPGFREIFTILQYAKKYHLTWEEIDDALNGAAISLRRGAVIHPKSLVYGQDDFETMAKKAGFDDVFEYMKSPRHNPFVNWPLRKSNWKVMCDGAAAIVLCATEEASKYTSKTPIEVSGVYHTGGFPCPTTPDYNYHPIEEITVRRAYEMADLDPSEIDYFGLHDFNLSWHLIDPEIAGYIPPGKSWKYLKDLETAFDGMKPIQTHGGEIHFGDCYDPASIIDVIEAVQQMRGECGERQIHPVPKCAVIFGRGTGPVFGVTVLRRKEAL